MAKFHSAKTGRASTRRNPPRSFASRPLWALTAFCLLLLSFLLPPSSFSSAQTTAYAEIGAPDTSDFPTISVALDVYDASGQFVSGLGPKDLAALEDGNPRPVQELAEEPIGAQIVIGVNPGPALDVRDGQGVTRYQKIQQALGVWAQARGQEEPLDDLSLVTIAGPLIAHTAPESWLTSFTAFQPDFRATTPNITSLALSLDVALTDASQLGMKRAILFITPHIEDPELETALAAAAVRAMESRTRISIWMVDGEQFFNHPSAALFQTLATQTGGGFFAYSGRETLPDPETTFAPLRRVYRLTYASSISASGEHTLGIEVTAGDLAVTSAPQTFAITVQAPNPIFATPPMQITRAAPPEDPYNQEVLLPEETRLQIFFDFPDGHPRPITRAALYVDGALVAENTTGALDRFDWDLRGYTASGQHLLKVEATDSLGLTGSSIEIPVNITVTPPPSGLVVLVARYRFYIVYGVVGFAGLILLTILFGPRLSRSRRKRKTAKQQYADPLTQPISAVVEPPTARKKQRTTRPDQVTNDAWARLVRLNADGTAGAASPIPLSGPDVTLGTDPVQSAIILDDPMLSPLHARIQQDLTGSGYLIFDQNSLAGTWVNYEPVTREGHPLNHGDRVHFGNLMYRFELKNPPEDSEPAITLIS